MKKLLIALALCGIAARPAYALVTPANALVSPFDSTDGHVTFLLINNVGPKVTAHLTFFSDDCTHLANFSACLTHNDTLVADTTHLQATNEKNEPTGAIIDLSGKRGTVVITAFSTNDDCNAADGHASLVDSALIGSFTLANTRNGSAFGSNMIGLHTDSDRDATALPTLASIDELDIPTFNPASLDDSEIILLALQQSKGGFGSEVGPLGRPNALRATLSFTDTSEVRTSLPDVEFDCALFSSALPGGLIPDTVTVDSSGYLRLSDFAITTPVATVAEGTDEPDDLETFVYAWHGMAIGSYGVLQAGSYILNR